MKPSQIVGWVGIAGLVGAGAWAADQQSRTKRLERLTIQQGELLKRVGAEHDARRQCVVLKDAGMIDDVAKCIHAWLEAEARREKDATE